MAKARSVEAKLSRLRVLRHEPATAAHLAELRAALSDRSNLVAAEAAEIVGSRGLAELAPDLVTAFDRFMEEPEQTDKLCRAKLAIVETLNKIESEDEDVFVRALKHVQLEGRWGGGEDTAAALRGAGAFGLVRINFHDVTLLLADLLADPERVARTAAARALGASRAPAALPLLRFKARMGDKDPEVTGECLAALMVAAPRESLAFVKEFLETPNDDVQQGAALAIAEWHTPEALQVLKEHWARAPQPALGEVLLLAMSMTRLPAALDFLLEVLASDDQNAARAALSALAIHRHQAPLAEQVAAVVGRKEDAVLRERFAKKFAGTK
jgi:HEAT repeat protein